MTISRNANAYCDKYNIDEIQKLVINSMPFVIMLSKL